MEEEEHRQKGHMVFSSLRSVVLVYLQIVVRSHDREDTQLQLAQLDSMSLDDDVTAERQPPDAR